MADDLIHHRGEPATDDDVRGIVMRFTPAKPMMVTKSVWDALERRGILSDPAIWSRVKLILPLPPATK